MSGFSGYSETGQGGEERGPSTFAFRPPSAPQTQAAPTPGQLRAGVVKPQDTFGVLQAKGEQGLDRTLEGVLQFADKAFGKKLEDLRQENFLKGMQRGATGEALTEIINEQPWYSRIFGESGVADGARAYTVQASVTAWTNEQERNMGELRKQSPDSIPAYMNGTINQMKTGDQATDVMMGMNIMKLAPDVMKRQAKENYKYQQEQGVKARYSAMSEAATSFQMAAATPDMYTPEDVQGRLQGLYSALVLKPGEDEDSQKSTLKTFIGAQAAAGNFHVLNQMEADGIFKDLAPEDQAATSRAIRTAQSQNAADAGDLYGVELFDIRAKAHLGQLSAKEVREQYEKINSQHSAATGNPRGVVRPGTIAQDQWSAIQAVVSADKANAKAAADAAGDDPAAMLAYLSTGGTSKGAINAGAKSLDVDTAVKAMFDKAPTVEAKVGVLVRDAVGGHTNRFIEEDISKKMLSVPTDYINDDLLELHSLWKVMGKANGTAAMAAYFPGSTNRLLAAFNTQLGGRDPMKYGDVAWQQANAKMRNESAYRYKDKEEKQVREFVATDIEKNAWYKSREFNLTPSSSQTIVSGMATEYGSNKLVLAPDAVMPAALASAKANGLEVAGNYAWYVDPNRARTADYFKDKAFPNGSPVTEKELGHGINKAVEQQIKFLTDKTPDDVQVFRVADKEGRLQFQVMARVGGEYLTPMLVDQDDINSAMDGVYSYDAKAGKKRTDAETKRTSNLRGNKPIN